MPTLRRSCLRHVSAAAFFSKTRGTPALSWAGSREGALRVVAMLRIIDAAELAHALQYVQEREAADAGRVINAEAFREAKK